MNWFLWEREDKWIGSCGTDRISGVFLGGHKINGLVDF